jgi:aldehyde:ferredoxin oxidoreductase
MSRPRILEIDLSELSRRGRSAVAPREWRGSSAAVDRVGALGGGALSAAVLYEHALREPGAPAPLVVAVGDCVRRGVPTAARASVASRAPLTGRLSEGQVGSDLARRLAVVSDALVLSGRASGPHAVLAVGEREVELLSAPETAGLSPRDTHARLAARFGACATLSIGLAGERGLPVASLAAGGDALHFVGRGGVGAVLARLGLKAIAVLADARDPEPQPRLVEALLRSPRLAARCAGGTFEMFGALARRGELAARGGSEPVPPEVAREIEREASALALERRGCRGCPTPCGWVFDRPGRAPQSARFGAAHALGLALGLERVEDVLDLYARCDELGLDAKEIGAGLALLCAAAERGLVAGGSAWGSRGRLREWIDASVGGDGAGSRLARGAAALADELGLRGELALLRGEGVRRDSNLASLLGQLVSPRGADPMRVFPFAADGSPREALAELVAPMELPPGAEDPRDPAGKGRLVWWHENLANALDATGFCAFSAAALLSDRVLALDELAREIAPRELDLAAFASPARALLAAGERVAVLQRLLNERWRPDERFERALGPLSDAWDEYAALRGLDGSGRLTGEAKRRFESGERADPAGALAPVAASAPRSVEAGAPRARGTVRLRLGAALAKVGERVVEVAADLPAPVGEIARAAARSDAALGALYDGERLLPAVYRGGARLDASSLARDGDVLDLVLVVSGG